jgi:tRNA(Ile)-lysidine synthase
VNPLPQPAAPARPVLAAFSGGLDSTVLLHWLATHPAMHGGLRAIHVDHGLHPDSAAWAAHCREACAALGVPVDVVCVDVARDSGHGPEAAARTARHGAFVAALREGEVLALAHHADDQAETFLLRALRASGPDGLAAMRPWLAYRTGWAWRPLLDATRETLREYARTHALDWIDDPSNGDPSFDRNYLRREVMPRLQARWPHAAAAFSASARLSGEAADLLDAEDARLLASLRGDGADTIDLAGLVALPAARRARVLRHWVAELGLPPLPANGVARIEHELLPARRDAEPVFGWSGARLRRWRDLLHAGPVRTPLPDDWEAWWDGCAPLALPGGGVLRLEGAGGFDTPLRVRARRGGERMVLPGRSHHHALKHVLQALGVPPWERERLPLLEGGDGKLLAAGDRAMSAALHAWLEARGARLAWTP